MEIAAHPPSTIVPEVLKENNYERWSIFMEHYLVAQDLWDVVQSYQMPEDGNTREWIKKNALALHAIKISCGAKAFNRIKKIQSAKCAWDVLGLLVNVRKSPVVNLNIAELHEVVNPYIFELNEERQTEFYGTPEMKMMLDCIYHGSFWDVQSFFTNNPREISVRVQENGYTALHVAISAGQQWIAQELITMTSVEDLGKQDNSGNTALSLAASNGMMTIAKCLNTKNKKLLTIPDTNGKIPVMLACGAGHEDMTRYLYRETPLEVLEGDNSFYLLQECITKKMFGLAFRCPSGSIPIILTLAQTPPPFFRRSQLGFWGQLIYDFIRVKADLIRPRNQQSCAQKIQHFYRSCALKIQHFHQRVSNQPRLELCGKLLFGLTIFPFALLGGALLIPPFAIVTSPCWILMAKRRLISLPSLILETLVSVLTRLFAKHLYNLKLKDHYARQFICHTCGHELSNLDHNQFVQSGAVEAIFHAIKNGIPDVVIEMINANANITWSTTNPEDSRNVFACAVSYRQEKLARRLYELGASKDTNIVSSIDEDGNNLLHLAAKLAPHSHLSRISGAALQLQTELRWFKAVEGVVPRFYSEQKNKDGETAFQLFVKEHKNLLKEAEEWVKRTAESSTVVGTLIITIMFAVAFTVPGGNDQVTGFPIFLPKKPVPFTVFIVSDAVSLFSASTAALMFLGILTSRFAYEDFLKSLPRKLIIGLSSLFISIASMMAAFCAALFIMFQGQLSIVVPITLLAGLPVTLFVLLQSPLFIEIYVSTFSSDIFSRRRMKILSKISEFSVSHANFFFTSGDLKLKLRYLPSMMLFALWNIFCEWG